MRKNIYITIVVLLLIWTKTYAQVPCDTINFMEYQSSDHELNIYDEYVHCGALFLGEDSTHHAQVSYHPDHGGAVLHSEGWYKPIKIKFIDPNNPEQYNPASSISYLSPLWPSDDYVIAKVYDVNDNLIKQHTSYGLDTVNMTFSSYIAAYIIFDDSLSTSYSVDNISWKQNIVLSVEEKDMNQFNVYPNPAKLTCTINKKYDNARLLNSQGKLIESYYNQQQIDLSNIPSGLYFIQIDNRTTKLIKE